MKRFTETDKWKDPWFRALPPTEKLVFIFVIENCNNAGFYEIDYGLMAFSTGLDQGTLEGAVKGLARGLIGADGWVWVRSFLRHQKNENLNPENNAHKQIIALLKDQSVRFKGCAEFRGLLGASKGLASPIGKGTGKGKGIGQEEGVQGGNPKARATVEEMKAFALTLDLPASDGEYCFHKWEGSGWTIGKKPIKDWKATVRSWKTAGYLPSQKPGALTAKPTVTDTSRLGPTPVDAAVDEFFATP